MNTIETEYTCFYSYKGGVGRSLALANLAFLYANEGEKVLIIDLDLEAPGQHQTELFSGDFVSSSNKIYPGILDMLNEYCEFEKEAQAQQKVSTYKIDLSKFRIISRKLDRVYELTTRDEIPEYGAIHLLPATVDCNNDYQSKLGQWDWDTFYNNYSGAAFWMELKSAINAAGYSKVLIDSRTGLSDVFYISALNLSDNFVCVSGLNRQNVEGTSQAIDTIKSQKAIENYGHKKVIKVLSLLPLDRASDIERRVKDIASEYPNLPSWQARLYYSADLALDETILAIRELIGEIKDSSYLNGVKEIKLALEAPESMAEKTSDIRFENPFKQIRAEYCSEEEVAKFFVDPGGTIKASMEQFMPTIVFGARGTGKTTLARWNSFETQAYYQQSQGLSPSPSSIERIGLWFRIDIDILDSFNTADEELRPLFNRLFSQFWDLIILRKALEALQTFGGIYAWGESKGDEQTLYRRLAREMGSRSSPTNLRELNDLLEDGLYEIRSFINNPLSAQKPHIIQSNILIKLLVEKFFDNAKYKYHYFIIFIDEYENFHTYQQKIINTRLKQARESDRVTYKLFVRNFGVHTHDTLAVEQRLEETHDFRSYNLDTGLTFEQFKVHLSSVLSSLFEQSAYFSRVAVTSPEKLLADIDLESEASQVVGNNKQKLNFKIAEHLIASHSLLRWCEQSDSTLRVAVIQVLLSQGKSPDFLFEEFSSDSKKARDWYHNYKMGALFWLVSIFKGKQKSYAGFNTIVGVAGNNLRTALDLYYAIVELWWESGEKILPISTKVQTEAIRKRSESYFRKMKVELPEESKIPNFIERLGSLFQAMHKSPKQSEPEINHFVIRSGDISEQVSQVLKNAKQENFIRGIPGNKKKGEKDSYQEAYQISPRFVPFFKISWRRKKALSVTASELETLIFGDDEEWKKLFNQLKSNLSSEIKASQQGLF